MTDNRNRDRQTTRIALKMTSGVLQILVTIIFYVLVIFIITRLAIFSYRFAYQVMGNVSVEEAPGRDVDVTIEEGDSTMEISQLLSENHLVVNRYSFFVRAILNRKTPIIPGTYTLNTSMNYDDILRVITGKNETES